MKAVILLLVLFLVSSMKNVFSSYTDLDCVADYHNNCIRMGYPQDTCEERLRACLEVKHRLHPKS